MVQPSAGTTLKTLRTDGCQQCFDSKMVIIYFMKGVICFALKYSELAPGQISGLSEVLQATASVDSSCVSLTWPRF